MRRTLPTNEFRRAMLAPDSIDPLSTKVINWVVLLVNQMLRRVYDRLVEDTEPFLSHSIGDALWILKGVEESELASIRF